MHLNVVAAFLAYIASHSLQRDLLQLYIPRIRCLHAESKRLRDLGPAAAAEEEEEKSKGAEPDEKRRKRAQESAPSCSSRD